MKAITQDMIDRMSNAVAVNDALAASGIAMQAEVDGLIVCFDLAGREEDDPDVYTPENVIRVEEVA